MKNGAPISAVTMPMGSSPCVLMARVIVSQVTKNSPPSSAVFMMRLFTVDG